MRYCTDVLACWTLPRALSPPTVLYIPFDGGGDYFSTSRMCSASCASGLYLRVWGGDPRHGSGAPVRDVRSLFRPARAQNRLGQIQTPAARLANQQKSRLMPSMVASRCARSPTSLWHSSRAGVRDPLRCPVNGAASCVSLLSVRIGF
jgi:hypothetical protein